MFVLKVNSRLTQRVRGSPLHCEVFRDMACGKGVSSPLFYVIIARLVLPATTDALHCTEKLYHILSSATETARSRYLFAVVWIGYQKATHGSQSGFLYTFRNLCYLVAPPKSAISGRRVWVSIAPSCVFIHACHCLSDSISNSVYGLWRSPALT
jgi:hypothetical protein